MMDQSFMKTKPVLPLVVSMSMPMVLSMLVNALYNIVDSFFIARISEDAMTALSLVFPLQNIAGAVCIGFGVGVNAAVAFYLGAGRQKDADGAASLGVLLSLVHAVLLTIVLSLAARPFLQAFTDDPAVLDYGMRYARIVIVFSVINQVSLVYEKLFQAIGSMKVSMASMMAGCIVNVILDPVMIFGDTCGLSGSLEKRTTPSSYFSAGGLGQPAFYGTAVQCGHSGYAESGTSLHSDFNAERNSCRIFADGNSDPWHLLQASDLHLSDCKRHCTGHPAAGCLQLWSRRRKESGKYFPDSAWHGSCGDGSRNRDLCLCSGVVHRTVYGKSGNDPSGSCGASNHQCGISHLRRVCHGSRNAGGPRNGRSILYHFTAALPCGDSACSIPSEPGIWNERSMDGLPGSRVSFRRSRNRSVPEGAQEKPDNPMTFGRMNAIPLLPSAGTNGTIIPLF